MYKKLIDPNDGSEITNVIVRTSDGAFIPVDPANSDYQAYLEWVSQGNSISEPSGGIVANG